MTITRVTLAHDGEFSETHLPDTGGVSRSSDYQQSGITIQRGMGSAVVSSPEQLQDDDMLTIQGVQMSARAARELGEIENAFKTIRSPEELEPEVEPRRSHQGRGRSGPRDRYRQCRLRQRGLRSQRKR